MDRSKAKDLFDCVKEGDLDYIKSVKADVLLNARNEKGITILSAAIQSNKFDCCKEILKKCPSLLYIQETSDYNKTVLHYAIERKNHMMVDYFLGVGLDVATNEGNMVRFMKWIQLENNFGETALIQAIKASNLHAVKRLVELDREYKLGLSEIVDYLQQTALQLAMKYQDHKIIKLLTDEGDPYSDYIPYSIAMDLFDHIKNGDLDYVKTVTEDVLLNARNEEGISILSAAIQSNKFDCCKEILKKCPSLLYIQETSDYNYTVLHYAIYNDNYMMVDYLLGVGLDAATNEGNMVRFMKWIQLKNRNGETALIQATTKGKMLHTVKRLIELDREYKLGLSEVVNWNNQTALQLAVKYQDHEIMKLLTDEGDPYSDYIPYSIAMDLFDHIKNGDLDYVKTVTEDVLLNARNEEGISILSAAIQSNKFDCCKEILKKCPSLLYIQETSDYNYTVLHYAIYDDNYMMVDYLLGMGLDAATNEGNMVRFMKWIQLKNRNGETALIQATTKGKMLHTVKRLIELDREYKLGLSEVVNWNNQTALQLAVKKQDHEIMKLLTDEGDPYSDYIPYSIAMDLFDHIKNGDLDYVKTVTEDVLLNSRDEYRNSALYIATKGNQLRCCEEIFKRCPTLLYHQNSFKSTVLHLATYPQRGYYRLVDLFVGVALDAATIEGNVESKAENMQRFKNWINLQSAFDETALIQAVKYRHHDIVKRFLKVDRQYKLGLSEIPGWEIKTPLQLALEGEDQEMIKLLTDGTDLDLEHGANTDGNMSLLIATSQAKEFLHTGNNSDSAGTEPEFEYSANTNTDENMSLSIASTQSQEALHTGNYSNSVGADPDFKYGATTDGKMSLSIAATQAQEALHTGNNSDSAGKESTDDFYKTRHTSLATDRMEGFYVGEIDENSSRDSEVTKLFIDLANEKPRPYTHKELIKFTKEFSDLAGSGTFGDVYKGVFPNGVLIAVKVLKNSQPKLMDKQFVAELSTMGKTYHRNLIKLYGYCYEADMKALIYEYMEKGALDVILKRNNLDMVQLYTIAKEIARGISYLHESCKPQIIHLDLKPANVLLDSEFSPRVIDFGLAKLNLEKSQFLQSGLRGTRGYVAPEMTQMELGMINCKCDVFSFGMILFDILKSKINYTSYRWLPGQVWEKFKENKLDSFLKDHGIKEDNKANAKTLSIVALLCSEYNPAFRPSMSTVVKMLEGEVTLRQPVNPFPHYSSSSDSSSTYDSWN